MTDDDFRDLALALDGVVESAHMNHPDFRANGRIFATLREDGRTGMVKLTPEQQAVVMADHAGMFTPSAGAWGRGGCTDVVLARARTAAVRGALLLAWQGVMAPPRTKARAKASRRRG
jgi:hypothetical protein